MSFFTSLLVLLTYFLAQHLVVPALFSVVVYAGIALWLSVFDMAYYPFIISVIVEDVFRCLFADLANNNHNKVLILIGSEDANISLMSSVDVVLKKMSSHWLVLIYDRSLQQVNFVLMEAKPSDLFEATKEINLEMEPNMICQSLCDNTNNKSPSLHTLQTLDVSKDFTVRMACELSSGRTFPYVLCLSFFQLITPLMVLYYIFFLLDASQLGLVQGKLFRAPDFVFVLFIICNLSPRGLCFLQQPQPQSSRALAIVIHGGMLLLHYMVHPYLIPGLLFPVVMSVSFGYYYALKFVHDYVLQNKALTL